MDIPWDDARLFLGIVETGSLSKAARRLRVAQPTVSRRLAELEARLGEALFSRSVEGTSLTSFGERLVEPARRMAESAADLERAAERREVAPAGVVRITAPPGVAFDFLAPFSVWLRQKLPEVRLEVISTIHYLDLSRREADLALRIDRPAQRDLITVASLEQDVGAFASKRYVDRLPRRYGAADVDWIGWPPPLDHLPPNPQLAAKIPGFRPAFASDDFLVQLRAAEAGIGAIFLGRRRHRFSRLGALVELDLDFGRPRSSLHLLCARGALEIPRVRAVAELLRDELAHAAR